MKRRRKNNRQRKPVNRLRVETLEQRRLLALAPLFFPIVIHALGLLTGAIQAYIFSVLAMVYIASASRARAEKEEAKKNSNQEEKPNG